MLTNVLALGHGVTSNWQSEKEHVINSLHIANNDEGYCETKGKVYKIEKGDVCFLPCAAEYKLGQSEKLYDHTYLCFVNLSAFNFDEVIIIKKSDSLLYKTVMYIKELVEKISPYHHEGFYALVDFTLDLPELKLIEHLMDYFMFNLAEDKHEGTITDKSINDAMLFIHENYTKKIDLDTIASNVYLNKNYFIKKFREITGMTPYKYITELRISTVKTFHGGGMSISEACEKAGFSTTASYYRAVKNSKG